MFQKRNLGFTLIELLAVIVILAIIAVISTPMVVKTIDEAKKGAFKNSAYGIIKAAEYEQTRKVMNGDPSIGVTYTYTDGIETSNPSGHKLNFKGSKPQNGTIIINAEGKVMIAIHDGTYCAIKDYNNTEIILLKKSIEDCVVPYIDIILNGADPELGEGMIPIKWNGSNWLKADISQKWYDYTNKEWANVVLVTETTRNTYKTAIPGTIIKEADVLAYLVWAPRYRYKLFNVESTLISSKTIEIEFEDKKTLKSTGSATGEWFTHSAFTFGSDELNGFWVGKFESTGTITTPTVKPGKISLRNQSVSNHFSISQKFNNERTYGLTNDNDAHMMKNMEWGAVAYLSHSIYGKNAEIWINQTTEYITGCAGIGPSAEYSNECLYNYTTNNGQESSTTGNVYGIYDMSGGAWEYVMGGMYNSDNVTIMLSSSGFNQITIDSDLMSKYINKYTYGTLDSDYTRRQLGDATAETRSWYNDYMLFIRSTSPWFIRGGGYYSGNKAGIFSLSNIDGNASGDIGFRLTIS